MKIPISYIFHQFFLQQRVSLNLLKKKKRLKDIQQRANDLGRLKKISYLQIRVGIIDMVCIIDFSQQNRLFPHHFLYPPASALCVTFTAFGSANSVRSMTTPRSQEHGDGGCRPPQIQINFNFRVQHEPRGVLERMNSSMNRSEPAVLRATASGILWEISTVLTRRLHKCISTQLVKSAVSKLVFSLQCVVVNTGVDWMLCE